MYINFNKLALAIRLSLHSQQLHYAEFLKIPVVLIGHVNTISENEAGPSGRVIKGVGLRPLAC